MSQDLLLPVLYLPNISYFKTIKDWEGDISLERFENFPKQTFRTRTQIATANGILELIIPIVHGKKERVAIKDIRINYDHPWQRLHWLSLQTAYRSSAYFEFYEDDLAPFYEKKYEFLMDFHVEQLQTLLKLLKMKKEIHFTEAYTRESPQEIDYRSAIHPKLKSLLVEPQPYYQLFSDKNGFQPNLSIIDLLFSQGPQAKKFL